MTDGAESPDLLRALEAVLFMAAEPLSPRELAEILGLTPAQAEGLASELEAACAERGIQLGRVAGGYELSTRPEYANYVAKLHQPQRFRLTRASLETLAIIAYRQPITRPEIEVIRGVNSDGVISTLLNYRLIKEVGRKDAPGRPMLYATTEDFLLHFGLSSVRDLPSLDTLPVPEEQERPPLESEESPHEEAEPGGD